MSENYPNQPSDGGPRVTLLGRFFVLAFVAACGWGAYRLYIARSGRVARTDARAGATASTPSSGDAPSAEIGIAYGTEKKTWLEWAVAEFAKTDAGRSIRINLIPMGSLEGAQALVAGNEKIHVWSPASSLYKDTFIQDWTLKYSKPPIITEESLALSPMVFVMWKERYDAFKARYGELSFPTIAAALGEKGGWETIAGKGDWGLFKFGHTNPNESNSGLATLTLMAYAHAGKNRGLGARDVLDPKFQEELKTIEGAVTLSGSTGTMMREMVLKGPSAYDAVFVYESVAIDYFKSAAGRWGELQVVYPRQNLWNDNPYYIIDAPWSSPDQRKAADVFLRFLLSEPVQKEALAHGFRPGNPSVPVIFPQSPFVQYQRFGLRNEVGSMCEPPKAEVITNLLAAWQRSR